MIELCEYCLLYILLCASACLCLVLSVCSFPFATLSNYEDEITVAGFIGEDLDYLILLKTRDKPGPRQAILKACCYYYFSLSIMHVFYF